MKANRFSIPPIAFASTLALVLTLTAQHAMAAPSYCAGNTGGLSTSDMKYNGANANDCYGVVNGNINQTSDLNGLVLTWGTDWILLATDNVPPSGGEAGNTGTFMGIQFTLTADSGTSGNWMLTGTDVGNPLNLPAIFDFAGALKAGNEYALYFFNDVVFDGSDGGTWSILFTNNGSQTPALSHLSLFVRDGRNTNGGGPPTGNAPEPGVLLLMGAGLLGLGMARRRKPT